MHGSQWDLSQVQGSWPLAEHGHLTALQWALQYGYLYKGDDDTCSSAASGGQLATLQWDSVTLLYLQ